MDYRELDDLGQKISDAVNNAVNQQNYQRLNETVSSTVNRVFDMGNQVLRNAAAQGASLPNMLQGNRQNNITNFRESLYKKISGERAGGILMAVLGGMVGGGSGLVCLTSLAVAYMLPGTNVMLDTIAAVMALFSASGAVLLGKGIGKVGSLDRFQRYIKELGTHTYCNFDQLSAAVHKSLPYVKKDVRSMIDKGWFLEGHVDDQETCLITSHETYNQYMLTQRQLEAREQEIRAQEQHRQESRKNISGETQAVLDRGNEFIREIRACNDAIPGQEMTDKISHMELIVQRIFERAESHPEIIPDLQRMMDYYLPMTVKLLHAYVDMGRQPIQGENIVNSRREIEETIDTLNTAFEKILDSVFEDTAIDVSSDISVLHTILAQEGLTEDEFTKLRKEAMKRKETQ